MAHESMFLAAQKDDSTDQITYAIGMDRGCGHGYGPATFHGLGCVPREFVHNLQIAGRYYGGGKVKRCRVETGSSNARSIRFVLIDSSSILHYIAVAPCTDVVVLQQMKV